MMAGIKKTDRAMFFQVYKKGTLKANTHDKYLWVGNAEHWIVSNPLFGKKYF